MQELKTIENYFNTNAIKHKQSIESLNWGSKRTQEIRFHIFSEIANLEGKSILDVGCGFGDFCTFLQKKLGLKIDYTGVDISKEIVTQAKAKNPDLEILHLNILEEQIGQFDYVVGSGIHNIKLEDNYGFFQTMLEKMFSLAKEGVATNFIYKGETEFDAHIFAYEQEKILSMAQKLSPFLELRSDYLPHDMTLFLYKNDWATRHHYHEA